MAVYLTCALGCLALHYLTVPGTAGKPPSWRWLAGFVGRFSLVVAASAWWCSWSRRDGRVQPWDPLQRFGNQQPRRGRWPPNGPNQGANLNNTTPVELSPDEAFSFRATDATGPKLNVSPSIRFRSLVLETYQDESGRPTGSAATTRHVQRSPRNKDMLPDFGPGQYFLHFDVDAGRKVRADWSSPNPCRWGFAASNRRLPVRLTDFSKPHSAALLHQGHSGTLLPVPKLEWSRYHYKQVMPPLGEPNRVPAEVCRGDRIYIQELTRQACRTLKTWTAALLRRLAADGRYASPRRRLVPDTRWPDRSYIVPEYGRERWPGPVKYLRRRANTPIRSTSRARTLPRPG